MERRAKGSPFCFWFGSTDPHRPYEPGTGAQSGMNAGTGSGSGVPAGHRGRAQRSARLLLRSPAVRSRSRRASSRRSSVRASSRTRSSSSRRTTACRSRAPRPTSTMRGARVPLAIRWPGVSRAGHGDRLVRQPHRSGADDPGRRGADAARRDDRTQPAAAAARRVAGRTRSRLHRAGAPRERPTRRSELPGQSHQDEGLPVHQELPARSLAGGRPASNTSPSDRSATSTEARRSPCSWIVERIRRSHPFFQLATAKRPAEELYDLKRDPDQIEERRRAAPRTVPRSNACARNWIAGCARPATRARP